VKAGFPDLPKVFNAECLDMQYLQFKGYYELLMVV